MSLTFYNNWPWTQGFGVTTVAIGDDVITAVFDCCWFCCGCWAGCGFCWACCGVCWGGCRFCWGGCGICWVGCVFCLGGGCVFGWGGCGFCWAGCGFCWGGFGFCWGGCDTYAIKYSGSLLFCSNVLMYCWMYTPFGSNLAATCLNISGWWLFR